MCSVASPPIYEHSEYKQAAANALVQRQGRHCSSIVKKEAIDWKAEEGE
jgi:hypothetical protein